MAREIRIFFRIFSYLLIVHSKMERENEMKMSKTELETLLLKACEDGKVDKIQDLIKHRDVDVNTIALRKAAAAVNERNQTALHYTALSGHVDVVKVLIQNDADVNAVDKDKWTPLHYAATKHVDVAKVLIQNGADVNAVDKTKWTTLHSAASNGHLDLAKVLIQNGADVNAADKYNLTPLHESAFNGHVDVSKLLIRNGADVNAVDEDKSTPLHKAALRGQVEFAKVLIQNGADVNAADRDKWTPLHWALLKGHVDVAKVLIQNGADVISVDKDNKTPIYWAATSLFENNIFTLQLLCFGAAINDFAMGKDTTDLIRKIDDRMNLLRAGKRIGTSLMSNEERRFMWTLAFSLTIHRREIAFKVYHMIRSFVTFHGIFMTAGYDLGKESVWKR